jgi:hypothetical protein
VICSRRLRRALRLETELAVPRDMRDIGLERRPAYELNGSGRHLICSEIAIDRLRQRGLS